MTRRVDPFVPPSPLDETEPEILELVETGKKRGYLTYEELNTVLPDEMVDPDKLDELLVLLEERGVVLIDDTDLPRLGKAEFVVPAALEDGFQVVASDRQTLLVR